MAMTTSTESRESNPKSSANLESDFTLAGSHLSKFLTTVMILSLTSAGLRKVCVCVEMNDGEYVRSE